MPRVGMPQERHWRRFKETNPIENSFINSTFAEVAGITVYGIICNNLSHDGVYSREETARAWRVYSL